MQLWWFWKFRRQSPVIHGCTGVPQCMENSGEGSTSWLPMVCQLNLAVHFCARKLKSSEFQTKATKMSPILQRKVQPSQAILSSWTSGRCPSSTRTGGKRTDWKVCVVLILFHFKESAWDPGQDSGATQGGTRGGLYFSCRNCECSCKNPY